jgi:hypothetical protein
MAGEIATGVDQVAASELLGQRDMAVMTAMENENNNEQE